MSTKTSPLICAKYGKHPGCAFGDTCTRFHLNDDDYYHIKVIRQGDDLAFTKICTRDALSVCTVDGCAYLHPSMDVRYKSTSAREEGLLKHNAKLKKELRSGGDQHRVKKLLSDLKREARIVKQLETKNGDLHVTIDTLNKTVDMLVDIIDNANATIGKESKTEPPSNNLYVDTGSMGIHILDNTLAPPPLKRQRCGFPLDSNAFVSAVFCKQNLMRK
jgi:hypothetical protein